MEALLMKASEQALSDLHSMTAEVLKAQIKQMQDTGEADPKILSVAIKFLKDNNIECTSDDMKELFNLNDITLPSFEEMTKGEVE